MKNFMLQRKRIPTQKMRGFGNFYIEVGVYVDGTPKKHVLGTNRVDCCKINGGEVPGDGCIYARCFENTQGKSSVVNNFTYVGKHDR